MRLLTQYHAARSFFLAKCMTTLRNTPCGPRPCDDCLPAVRDRRWHSNNSIAIVNRI